MAEKKSYQSIKILNPLQSHSIISNISALKHAYPFNRSIQYPLKYTYCVHRRDLRALHIGEIERTETTFFSSYWGHALSRDSSTFCVCVFFFIFYGHFEYDV